MMKGKTIRYSFDCEKAIHAKVEKADIRIIGERNGTCPKVILSVWADTVNRALKKQLTLDDIVEICEGHSCQHHCVGFKSCMDQVAKDIKKELKEADHGRPAPCDVPKDK